MYKDIYIYSNQLNHIRIMFSSCKYCFIKNQHEISKTSDTSANIFSGLTKSHFIAGRCCFVDMAKKT